jgi:hypothetical protein
VMNTEIIALTALQELLIQQMYRLYAFYYGGTDEAQFLLDLKKKNYVLLLWSVEVGEKHLVGFSTQALIDFEFQGKRELAIFSGDTIIDHRYWGDQALPKAFCEFAALLKRKTPDTSLFWFLISKGHRTYRYLNAFAHAYFPHPLRRDINLLQQRSALVARLLFGEKFNATTGIVHFAESAAFLKPEWHVESTKAMSSAKSALAIKHFEALNPGYQNGDELVCMTELSSMNLRGLASQAFDRFLNSDDAQQLCA